MSRSTTSTHQGGHREPVRHATQRIASSSTCLCASGVVGAAWVVTLALGCSGARGPARSELAPVEEATGPGVEDVATLDAPSWLQTTAAELRAAAYRAAREPDAPVVDVRWDDAWVGVTLDVRRGDRFVRGTAWARPDESTRRWASLMRGPVVDPSSRSAISSLLRTANLPTSAQDWGSPLASLPEELQEMAETLARASCELPLWESPSAWDELARQSWVEECDETLAESAGALRVRAVAVALMADGEAVVSARVEQTGESLSLGEPRVRHLSPVTPPRPDPLLAQWVLDLGVGRCVPRQMRDLLIVEMDAEERFRAMTVVGQLYEGRGAAALQRALETARRQAPDVPIQVPLAGCEQPATSQQASRAWSAASAAARIATAVAGEPILPCCP